MSNQKTSRKRGLYFHARTCITKRQFLRVLCEDEFTTEVTETTEKCSPTLRMLREHPSGDLPLVLPYVFLRQSSVISVRSVVNSLKANGAARPDW
jgi:hypothetical protein